jgi:DNA-binding XRE family transcriptional regulator
MMSRTAEIINALRKQHKLTQQHMADMLGISRITLNSLENGRSLPGPKTALKIEQHLSYNARSLMLAGLDDQLDQHRAKTGEVSAH